MAGPQPGDVKKLKTLESENAKLEKLLATRPWHKASLQLPPSEAGSGSPEAGSSHSRAGAANHIRAHDFVVDACANGQQLECLSVADEFTPEYRAIDGVGSMRSSPVIEVLARLMGERGS